MTTPAPAPTRRRGWALVALVLVAAVIGAIVIACSGNDAKGGDERAGRRHGPTHPVPTGSGHAKRALGVDVAADPVPADVARYHRQTGDRPAVLLWFQSWDEPLVYPRQLEAARLYGSTPMVTWDPSGSPAPRLDDIAAGDYDDYLQRSAQLAASVDGPLFIRLAHEMNLDTWSWTPSHQGVSDAKFVAAWRHVVSVFRESGADNVQWVWSPNVDCGGRCPFESLYPGDRYVDWVSLDGYNYGPARGQAWLPLADVFATSYRHLTRLTDKPLLITATGCPETGGDKARWLLRGFLRDVPRKLPRVRGVVYSDRHIEEDWSVDTSRDALKAWQRVARSPAYSAPLQPGAAADG